VSFLRLTARRALAVRTEHFSFFFGTMLIAWLQNERPL
jgi:hypothetical protein